MSLNDMQLAAAFFAGPFLFLCFTYGAALAAFTAFDKETGK